MDIEKIRAILIAVENKSLSKAAEILSYTPSALSHIADSVEEELGITILKRTPTGIDWSNEGKLLESYFKKIIESEEELKNYAKKLSSNKKDTLRIGTYSSISNHILPPIIKAFRRNYPNIKVSIIVGNSLNNWLEKDIVDITLTDYHKNDNLTFVPFMKDNFVAVVPNSIFQDRKRIDKEELYKFTLITQNDLFLREYFNVENFKDYIVFSSVDDNSILSMVKEEIGVAILPSLVLKKHLTGIHTLKLNQGIYRTLGFSHSNNKPLNNSTKTFIAFLKNYFSLN